MASKALCTKNDTTLVKQARKLSLSKIAKGVTNRLRSFQRRRKQKKARREDGSVSVFFFGEEDTNRSSSIESDSSSSTGGMSSDAKVMDFASSAPAPNGRNMYSLINELLYNNGAANNDQDTIYSMVTKVIDRDGDDSMAIFSTDTSHVPLFDDDSCSHHSKIPTPWTSQLKTDVDFDRWLKHQQKLTPAKLLPTKRMEI